MTSAPRYSRLSRRISAFLLDSLILGLCFFFIVFLISVIGIEKPIIQSSFAAIILLSIEPVLVALTGSSIGHHISGLRVRRANEDKKIGLFRSYFRFLVKLPLGVLSLVSVLTTRRHQAIHDLVSDSIVILKDRQQVMPYEVLSERDPQSEIYEYPSKFRRVLVMSGYFALLVLLIGVLSIVGFSDLCIDQGRCSRVEGVFDLTLSVSLWVGIFVIAGMGWQGRLYGARRRVRNA